MRPWPASFLTPLLAALLLLVGACARDDSGPRVRIYDGSAAAQSGAAGSAPQRAVGAAAPVEVSPNGNHIVRRGQTLYAISRAYNAPLRALIEENDLSPPYRLEIGQRLRVPQAETYRVEAGDTVYGISRDLGVSMNELVRLNGIEPPYTVRVGERLLIPGRVSRQPAQQASAPDRAPPSAEETPQTPPSAEQIARRAAEALRETTAPDTVEPPPATQPSRTTRTQLPERDFRVTDAGLPRPRVKPEPPRRALASLAQPPARAASSFLRPVDGRIVSSFGPKGKGLHNDGLNIAAPRGAPIRAAENGVVAYAGAELKGFGNGVLIKHADGYMTFYAHAEAVLVERGQRVARGQTIARVGSSGAVDQPQLHFQIRKGRQALDPQTLLGAGA
ncbi:MAG: LysM peptidoglycan-binding domain-containing M23 family metallopeptidase [Nitratireductor sp.]